MPEVVIYAVEGRTLEQKHGLMRDITTAVVNNLGVKPEQVVVSIVETQKINKARGGVPFSERGP